MLRDSRHPNQSLYRKPLLVSESVGHLPTTLGYEACPSEQEFSMVHRLTALRHLGEERKVYWVADY